MELTAGTSRFLLLLQLAALPWYGAAAGEVIVTYADGRSDGGIRQGAAANEAADAPGNLFVFDQKLLAEDRATVIGRNAGYCIRTDPGAPDFSGNDHPALPDDPHNNYGQCTWTLSFHDNAGFRGSVVVSGREADHGRSVLAVTGGTGDFTGVTGELSSTPYPLDDGGMLFLQELRLSRPVGKHAPEQ